MIIIVVPVLSINFSVPISFSIKLYKMYVIPSLEKTMRIMLCT